MNYCMIQFANKESQCWSRLVVLSIIFSSQKKFCKKGVIVVINMLHTCNVKVKGNLISEINKCHLVH